MVRLIAFIVMMFIACPGSSRAGDSEKTGENSERATTVKSGKSNSSDRVGAAGDKHDKAKSPDQKTTVKSSKSNSSE